VVDGNLTVYGIENSRIAMDPSWPAQLPATPWLFRVLRGTNQTVGLLTMKWFNRTAQEPVGFRRGAAIDHSPGALALG
jgi:hypothetical protein